MNNMILFEGRLPTIDPSAFIAPTAAVIGDDKISIGCCSVTRILIALEHAAHPGRHSRPRSPWNASIDHR